MDFRSMCFWSLISFVVASVDNPTLMNGYNVNFNSPKGQVDTSYVALEVTECVPGESVLYNCTSRITGTEGTPQAQFFLGQGFAPVYNASGGWFGNSPGDQQIPTSFNSGGIYYISLYPICPSTTDCVTGKVTVELSCYAYNASYNNPIPVRLVNNRRIARYHLQVSGYVYFWFSVEPQDVKSDGTFTLYLSLSLWQGMQSSTQILINKASNGWPTVAKSDWATAQPPQKGDYLWSAIPLTQGVYYGAIYGASYGKSTIGDTGSDIGVTIKAGYNQAPSSPGFRVLPTFASIVLLFLSLIYVS